jgi:hypothetical protein
VELKSAAVIWPLLTVKSFAETFHGGDAVAFCGTEKISCVPVPGVILSIVTADAGPVLLLERPSITPITVARVPAKV